MFETSPWGAGAWGLGELTFVLTTCLPLSKTKHVVFFFFENMLLLKGKQDKWCNTITLQGFLIGSCYLNYMSN